MTKWYYLVDGQEVGPLEPSDLKRLADSGRLEPHDKVRRADTTKWYQAKQVAGLFAAGQSQTGVSPTAAAATSPAATGDRYTGSKPNENRTTNEPPRVPHTAKPSAVARTVASAQPSESDNSFRRWYGARLGTKPILLQVLLWWLYGFLWIPIWWLLSRGGQPATGQPAAVQSPLLENGGTARKGDVTDRAVHIHPKPPASTAKKVIAVVSVCLFVLLIIPAIQAAREAARKQNGLMATKPKVNVLGRATI